MFAKYGTGPVSPLTVLIALAVFLSPMPAMGQFLNDEFDRDEFVESDEDFAEGGQFGGPGSIEDVTEGGRYVDEEPAGPVGVGGVTVRSRTTQLRIEQEKQMLPLNVAWGAGTGLLLGGWFALIDEGDDRSTQRSIGLGAVLGALLGLTVGMKTVIAPEAPRAASVRPGRIQVVFPIASADLPRPPPFSIAFTLRF